MLFNPTKLEGAYIIEIEELRDNRGFFARSWCRKEFEIHSLDTRIVQSNIGFSPQKGTLRGLHYQKPPYEEVKLVRCTRGAMYDVIVDLRPHSRTYMQWIAVELTASNHKMLYAPEGFAQGYLTLEDNTEMCYQTSQFYSPQSAWGARFDDPVFGIDWPNPIEIISEVDKTWPNYIP